MIHLVITPPVVLTYKASCSAKDGIILDSIKLMAQQTDLTFWYFNTRLSNKVKNADFCLDAYNVF